MNTPTKSAFLALKHGMGYPMHHPHEPIMYSRNKINRTEEIPHQCYFKSGDAEIRKTNEYSNFLHTYCDADNARDISYKISATFIVDLLNGTTIDWCSKKYYETSIGSSNAETRAMHKGVLDQKWIRDFFRSIGYHIGPP